ncbi:MAG: hypothetical protein ACTHU0_39585 [Kofleriaceae bacterium]
MSSSSLLGITASAVALPAKAATVAWQNVFSATGDDEARALLNRTICLEWFPQGIQLIATNGHLLLRAWVAAEGEERSSWPSSHARPDRSMIVLDTDGFVLSFIRALAKLTSQEGHAYETLSLSIENADEEPALGEELEAKVLTLKAAGQRLDCKLLELDYPNWRSVKKLWGLYDRVDGIAISPRLLRIIGSLKGVSRVDLKFSGDDTYVDLEALPADGVRGGEIRGFVMPMRRPEREED